MAKEPILFAAAMYHSGIISNDSYRLMRKLNKMSLSVQSLVMMNILGRITDRRKYDFFVYQLKKISLEFQTQIVFIGLLCAFR